MRRFALAVVLSAALLAAAAGCGGEARPTTTDSAPVPRPTDTLLVYGRSGGFIGVRDRLAVRPDGAIRVETRAGRRRGRLSLRELDDLRRARDAVDWAGLRRRYGSDPPPADGYVATVRAEGRTVTVVQGGTPPRRLARLLAICAGIVERHGPR